MTKKKRLRVFAGPNGSGKTTLAKQLIKDGKFRVSCFVNADEIKKNFHDLGVLDFDLLKLKVKENELIDYLEEFGISTSKLNDSKIPEKFKLSNNKLTYNEDIHPYIACDLAAFIREKLISNRYSFVFETVFSHPSKLELMKKAKSQDYKIYFYFIATSSPQISINRVKSRVAQNGHTVPTGKIKSRYFRSLDLLLDAVKVSDQAYLFDNSKIKSEYICQISNGKNVEMAIKDNIPNWFIDYVYNKI